jgi:hypothetical protein
MAHELPAKLRLTAALLGCNSRKELCARFRAVNPSTAFDLERSHKWLQGRAQPRTAQVYEDWARLLGTERSGAWLGACTLDAFLDEVCALFAADRRDLVERAGLARGGHAAAEASAGRAPVHYLCGAYAAYSHTWSLYFRGQLIRGSLLVQPGKGGRFPASYREALPAGPVELTGVLGMIGRMLHVELRDAGGGAPAYITAFLPGRPASLTCGILSGATFMSPDPEPSATRIAFVRVAPAATGELHASNRYLPFSRATLAADLAALGVAPAEPEAAAAELARFLGGRDRRGGLDQVGQADQARLARLFDTTSALADLYATPVTGADRSVPLPAPAPGRR